MSTTTIRAGRRVGALLLVAALLALAPLGAARSTAGAAAAGTARAGTAFRLVRAGDGRLVVQRSTGASTLRAASGGSVAASAGWELDTAVRAMGEPNESAQWGFAALGFPTAWKQTTGAGITVAVVDSGVRRTHEDLAGAVLPGIDLVTGSGDGSADQNGHGTHVAAIVAARRNGRGGVGGAPGAKILPVRVLDAQGQGYTSDVAQGILWAADNGARVINLSLGGTAPSAAMQQAIQYANGKGAVVVAAAGNKRAEGNPVMYPAAYPEAIAVAAVDGSLRHAAFSEMGSWVDVAAPGVNVLSAWGSGDRSYAYATGTSMATPFVSATAALVLARTPSLSAGQVAARLTGTARDLGPAGRDSAYGAGLVQPAAALAGPTRSAPPKPRGTEGKGYWVVASNGRVKALGGARWYGDLRGSWVFSPTVAAAPTRTGKGYWLATADGRVVPYGDARFYGDMARARLNGSIVAMAATATGKGYWLMGRDGGVFSFGDARFYGSTGAMRLAAPALDLAATASGRGYWFVARDGGVFTFGDARFRGSTGGMRLWQPVTSMTASADGRGYWLVARDGGIFAFAVPFRGSLASQSLPGGGGVRIRAVPSGRGYYVLTADGGVYPFGSAKGYGSAAGALGAPAVDLLLAP